MYKKLTHFFFKALQFCLSVFPIKRNRVFFISFYGNSYSDNPKAVSEALHERYGDAFEHVWVLNHRGDDVPSYVRACRFNTLRMLYYQSTSQVWISNSCISKSTYKRRSQFFIQTWHGDRGFKKILLGIEKNAHYLYETEHADLMTVGSDYGLHNYIRKGFGYQGEVLAEGCPRNDIFFRDTTALQKQIRQRYGISDTCRVLMFAPTFRKRYRNSKQAVALDLEEVRNTLEHATSEKWVVLVRSHIANSRQGMNVVFSDAVIDVTSYPDMNELLQVTDILISDYSSSIGDFALSGKLCLLFQDDLEEYKSHDRNLEFELEDSPFYHFHTQADLCQFLQNVSEIDAKANSDAILAFYGTHESGKSSLILSEMIAHACGKG